jgi:hypothetical protein
MKSTSNHLRLIAVLLLTFLVIVGIVIWLLDLVTQQRIFGFLMSAEFVAFALLVYLYYEENPQDINKKLLLSGFIALGILVLLAAAVFAGVVNMTLINVGQMSHDWALVTANQTSASVLFHAQIASGTFPLATNQTGSIIFTVTKSGNFYYVCQVPGHVQLGMWGSVVINP